MSPGHSFLGSKAPAMPVRVFYHDLTADAHESGNQVPKPPGHCPMPSGIGCLISDMNPWPGNASLNDLASCRLRHHTENCENPDIPEHFSQVLKMVFSTVTLKMSNAKKWTREKPKAVPHPQNVPI